MRRAKYDSERPRNGGRRKRCPRWHSVTRPIQQLALMLLPSILFFSYHPAIYLFSTNTMNLELSLPLVWLAATALISLPLLPQVFRSAPRRLILALALIPTYTIISLLWSSNPLRTFLSAGILACIALTLLALPIVIKSTPDFKAKALRYFLITAVLVSVFAWLQCILDVAGVSRSITLLCEGCTYQAFGFPHPSAFAIEPQFFGNLLLAPVFLCYYSLLCNKSRERSNKLLWPVAIFLTITLLFTFSRGAIYAFLASISVLIVFQLTKKQAKYLKLIPVILCSAIVSLLCQGIFAQLSPTNDTFVSGITKSIHHLTLGTVDLREIDKSYGQSFTFQVHAPAGQLAGREGDTREDGLSTGHQKSKDSDIASSFSGYVPESTDFRLTLTDMALDIWDDSPRTLLLGAGLGGAGTLLYQKYPELGTAKQIVQNEYASLLLEFGIIGIIVILTTLYLITTSLKITDKEQKSWLLALLLAFALTLCFFSGLPNALHIYLLPAFALLLSKHQFLVHGVVQHHRHRRH